MIVGESVVAAFRIVEPQEPVADSEDERDHGIRDAGRVRDDRASCRSGYHRRSERATAYVFSGL